MRKTIHMKSGWLSQVEDGVPFNLDANGPVIEEKKKFQIIPRKTRTVDLWTVQEVSDYLRVHKYTVYGWIYQKRLAVKKAGRLIRIEVSELERFLSCA